MLSIFFLPSVYEVGNDTQTSWLKLCFQPLPSGFFEELPLTPCYHLVELPACVPIQGWA